MTHRFTRLVREVRMGRIDACGCGALRMTCWVTGSPRVSRLYSPAAPEGQETWSHEKPEHRP